MAIIGIDMDGTIADFTSLAIENVNRMFNLNLTVEDMVEPRIANFTYQLISKEEQSKYNTPEEMYGDICPPEFFYDIKPFDGAIEAVKKIYEQGHKIVFITKPLEWEHCPSEKKRWLDLYFPDMKYDLMLVSSMEIKGLVQVDIMIEDDPRTIESLSYATPILVKQPWNQSYKFECVDVNSFAEIPDILDEVIDNMNCDW